MIAGLPPTRLGLPVLWPGNGGGVVYSGWEYVDFKCAGSRSMSSEACPVNVSAGTVDIAGC